MTTTSGFKTPLIVEEVGPHAWRLVEPLIWAGTKGDTIIVQAGAVTDFASTPDLLQSIFPNTGTWTKAAVVHDKLCDELNARYNARQEAWESNLDATWEDTDDLVPKTRFSSVDTDAVFELIMEQAGTGWFKRKIGWLGVRWGALKNPARRDGWLSTAVPVIGYSLLLALPFLVLATLAVAL